MMKPGTMERSLKITRQRTTPIKAIADVAINNRRTGNRSHNMMRKLRERKTLPKPFAAAPAIHLAFVTPLSSSLEAAPPPGRIGTTLLVGLRVLLLNPLNVLITIPFLYKFNTNDRPKWPTHQEIFDYFSCIRRKINSSIIINMVYIDYRKTLF